MHQNINTLSLSDEVVDAFCFPVYMWQDDR